MFSNTSTMPSKRVYKIVLLMWMLLSTGAIAAPISTIAGTGTAGFAGDGAAATVAQLNNPTDVFVDSAGNVYIADEFNDRIRKIDPSGVISTVAGNGTRGYSGDGGAATSAALNLPFGVFVDGAGNIYIAERFGHRIRKVDTAGIISTIAGTGAAGVSGDGGPATSAQLSEPRAVAVDATGNIYIVDYGNDRIRRIDTSGTINTIVGTGVEGFSGDGGPAISAQLYDPQHIFLDGLGNFYIAESTNNRIRKVDTAGIITTVVGTGVRGFSGDGGLATNAQLGAPHGVAVDSKGNLYIGDLLNNRIRKVDTSGIISTVVGTGVAGFSGDGGPATSAQIDTAPRIALDGDDNLYIVDQVNHRIRKVDMPRLRLGDPILFYSNVTGNFELYSIQPDGTNQTQLTNEPAADLHSVYSPDGSRILFVSERDGNREIYIMDANGSNPTRLTNAPGVDLGPSFSPDGNRIAFSSDRDGDYEIYLMDPDGSNLATLTSNGVLGTFPSFSPDGTRIVFESRRDGNNEIYVMNADGSNQTRLTNTSAFEWQPSFSPDGTRIAFASERDGHREIYVMNADGSNQTRVTVNAVSSLHPYWSPDGGHLIFASLIGGSRDLYIMSDNGSNLEQLTNNGAENNDPNWRSFRHIGTAELGASATRTMVVENTGTGPLNISNISFDNGDFSALPTTFIVAPGSTQNVVVTFSPLALDTQYATMTIASDDPSYGSAQIVVNGTGMPSIINVSLPDLTSLYGQPITVSVEVSTSTGSGIVSAEIFVAFDGDILTPFSSPVSSTAMTSDWTIETNIIQGSGTSIDTLKIAMANEVALSGAGDLLALYFDVADVRVPSSSLLALVHVLLNDGQPENINIDGALTLVGTDGIITSLPQTIIPRWSINVNVSDIDEDWDINAADSFVIAVSVNGGTATETLSLSETGISTGLFTATIPTRFSQAPVAGNDTLEVVNGDRITFTYIDSLDASGSTTSRSDSTSVIGGINGTVQATVVVQPGDTSRVKVVDADLSGAVAVQIQNLRSGETGSALLSAFSPGSSVFYGRFFTDAGAGVSGDSTLSILDGDTLRVSYSDTLTAEGSTATETAQTHAVVPFGDANDNGSSTAFDAALTLLHVLSPNLGLGDSLSVNVDVQAPFGPITPFDASLILQKRVGLIDRFPVQEPTSVNQPQPETTLQPGPKRMPDTRWLSLRPGADYLSVWAEDRAGILSGDLLIEGVDGKIQQGQAKAQAGEELGGFLVQSRATRNGLRVVFAGAEAVSGPGELLRVYGVGPQGAQLVRAAFNDGRIGAQLEAGPQQAVPVSYALHANVPNPFNPETIIRFELPEDRSVRLEVYDVLGQRVRVLVAKPLSAGSHRVVWDGRNSSGMQVSSGAYFYRLQAGAFVQTRRMMLLK